MNQIQAAKATQSQGDNKLPAPQGTDPRRETNNRLGYLRATATQISQQIDENNKVSAQKVENYFRSVDLRGTATPENVKRARTEIQVAAAKTEVELIEIWARQNGKSEALENWLKKQGMSDGKFPKDSKVLLGDWYGELSLKKGGNAGLLEKFHQNVGVIMNIRGSCPIQLLAEVKKLFLKIEAEVAKPRQEKPEEPPVVVAPKAPQTEDDISLKSRRSSDAGALPVASAEKEASVVQGRAPGDLVKNRERQNYISFVAGFLAASPAGNVIKMICPPGGGLNPR